MEVFIPFYFIKSSYKSAPLMIICDYWIYGAIRELSEDLGLFFD